MAHSLNVVTVRVQHERGVVVGMIMRPQSGRAVVAATCRECGAVKRIDGLAAAGRNRDVQAAVEATLAADPEIRLVANAESARPVSILGLIDLHHQHIAERRQSLCIERQ